MINQLNREYGIDGVLRFELGQGAIPQACITTEFAKAVVSLHGAQVLSYVPSGQQDILWVSHKSHFEEQTAIRGGIPICWPWFNAHPTDADKPSHGFARLMDWSVVSSELTDEGDVSICFALESSDESMRLWPYRFQLTCWVRVGRALRVELNTSNLSSDSMRISAALHSYFAISDPAKVRLYGLENTRFIDALSTKEFVESAPPVIDREIDRVYLEHTDDCLIADAGLKRTICVSKSNSHSVVVWNPWIDKSRRMRDFGNDEYKNMICVETVKIYDDIMEIEPGTHQSFSTTIRLV